MEALMNDSDPEPISGLPDADALANDPAFVEHATRVLGDSELADGMPPAQLARLAAIAEIRAYRAGELLCDEHEQSDELYVIEGGTLDVWLNPASIGVDAAPRRIAELRAGQSCGELALLDGGVRSARVSAGPLGARVAVFRRDAILTLCEVDTAIGFRLMRNLASALALRMRLQDMRLYSQES
jgi:CRP/FNR family transcriptional regulator, cyclic AMP receptor protein